MVVGAIDIETIDVWVDAGTHHETAENNGAAHFIEHLLFKGTPTRKPGDIDSAIEQLNRALADNARDPNALFNLGMIRLQGKGDSKGALAAWRQLLKSNPDLSADRKQAVMKAMADALAMSSDEHASASTGVNHASN